MKTENTLFSGWFALQHRLDNDHCLKVVEYRGREWTAKFKWNEPASPEQVESLKSLNVLVPAAYVSFLQANNGCRLFVDRDFGQWGYVLYSAEELISKREMWAALYNDWPKNYLVFGECLGDSDLLVFNTEFLSFGNSDCEVVCFPSAYYPERESVSKAFQTWLDYLIIAQGAKFWRWE